MKRILLLVAAAALFLGAAKNPRQAYVDRYYPLAVLEMQRTGVPASITLAQGLLESGAGLSPLATVAHNHFGLKCHNDWDGDKYFKDDDKEKECFRAYPTDEDSFRAHSDFLRGRERYKSLFELKTTDYKGWAHGLRRAGYATDPGYATKLINLIEDFQLYRYDTMTEDDLPAGAVAALAAEPVAEPVAEPAAEPALEEPVRPQTVRETPAPAERAATPAVVLRPEDYKESVSLSLERPVYKTNGVRYVRAVEGESWARIAAEYRLSVKQLLRYNDLDRPIALTPGMRIYLERKKPQASDSGLYEVDQDGRTLWDISQMFGVQLKKLMLYNGFRSDMVLEAGDTVILRKL